MVHTIAIVVERDEKTGEVLLRGDYKDLPIDMLYEATKFIISQMLVATASFEDPVAKKTMHETLRGCQYLIKGGEAVLSEARARAQRQG